MTAHPLSSASPDASEERRFAAFLATQQRTLYKVA
jgi:hypothetical protein